MFSKERGGGQEIEGGERRGEGKRRRNEKRKGLLHRGSDFVDPTSFFLLASGQNTHKTSKS